MGTHRKHWIDTTRGLCGIAVVLHHAIALCAVAGYTDVTISVLDDTVSPFRMPLLMSLSGAVLAPSLGRPLVAFSVRRLRTIVWPYVLWSVVVLLVTGSLVPAAVVRIATVAPTYLWFLQFLAIYAMIGWIARRAGVHPLVLAGVALGASAVLPEAHRADRFAYLLAFFLLGVALRTTVLAQLGPRTRVLCCTAGILATSVGVVAAAFGAEVRYDAAWSPTAIGLVVALFALFSGERLLDRPFTGSRVASRALRALGRNAVVLYVTHLAVITLTLDVLAALDGGQRLAAPVVILLVVMTAGATAGGFIVARRIRAVDALFVMPALRGSVTSPDRSAGRRRAATRRA